MAQSGGPSVDAPEPKNLRSRPAIRKSLTSDGLGEQRPGEPAVPTAAHDEQVGAMCRVEQHAGACPSMTRCRTVTALPAGMALSTTSLSVFAARSLSQVSAISHA